MKKLNILFLLIIGLMAFASCEDDKDPVINPAAEDGSLTFRLNYTRYSDWVYVLDLEREGESMDALTCMKPDFGYAAVVTYTIEISLSNTFTEGNYRSLATTITGEEVPVNVKEINEAIVLLHGGNEGLPDPLTDIEVFVRLKARVSPSALVSDVYSNTISLRIIPYPIPDLRPYYEVTLKPYYIIGLGDGAWNNSAAGLGVSIIPLNPVEGAAIYDLNGNGQFIYNGYFEAGRGFKLIRDIGSWDEQWGSSDGALSPIRNDGGSSNFFVPTSGYYQIRLNSIEHTLVIESVPAIGVSYGTIGLIGDFTSWDSDIVMTPFETANNHVWYTTYTFAGNAPADGGAKFRANGNWDVSWGGAHFPVAISDTGDNILYEEGTYVVIFNDIDRAYYFIKQ